MAIREINDNTYIDQQTGLIWAKDGNISGDMFMWDDAMNWASKLNYGGYSDWRLPTKEEFVSFVKRGGSNPPEWFNTFGFRNVQITGYWSSSVDVDSAYYAWNINMRSCDIHKCYKFANFFVWPVRGQQLKNEHSSWWGRLLG